MGQFDFEGRVPIWKPGGTLIFHIDGDIAEAGISLSVSYIGLAISELDEPLQHVDWHIVHIE